MEKIQLMVVMAAALLPLLLGSCVLKPAATEIATPREVPAAVIAKSAWEEDWEHTLAAARKEGSVAFYTFYTDAWRTAFTEAMAKKYGIRLDVITATTGGIVQRIMTEYRNQVHYADAMLGNRRDFDVYFRPEGVVGSLDKVIVLPENSDPRVWWRGELPWLDPDTKTYFNDREYVSPSLAINTDLVKPGDIRSYSDLLNPKWKGKMTMVDPAAGGGVTTLMVMFAYGLMSWDYVEGLAKQEPVLSSDWRLTVEWTARGKYPLLIGPQKEPVLDFMKAGAPIAFSVPSEGVYLTTGAGFMLLKNSPHPNAAKVFTNFYFSKEGQTLSSRVTGYQSSRIDVPTDYLLPALTRQPDVKYVSTIDKGFRENEVEFTRRVIQIFGSLKR
ncbi:MAG: extracellular solute-binding protein [Chloroflexi bacterium]|nr:extracellular solute-binding protein [Chloroflexota bacterium]